ncbi:hypothetical protein KMZ93_03720 [Bradyrhizobium sediminis]|uniref:Uncharacterized protein n=1 Tax=Bradyrhizobium sediminis TaxID=2840469 RepID=A0A975NZY3_9BRAD|nr:hypothetical protein [Bradyrhizobium sediminis]QWG24050.1 hypothetical protein KMZ93_03720 [Bradyrhizobium sediminis]
MTIIAYLNVGGAHSLIGDLLISGKGDQGPTASVNLPASRDVNSRFSFPKDSFAVGLQQKVVVLNASLAIAWSGSFLQAQGFFEDLEPLRAITRVDPTFLQSILDNIERERIDDLSIIAMVAHDGQCSLVTHRVDPPTDYGVAENVVCSGSGSNTFRELISQHAANLEVLFPNLSKEEQGANFDLNLVGSMQSEEFSSPSGILAGWGGGFEVARLSDGRISKIDNIFSLHFYVREGVTGELDLYWLPDFRHTSYWNDITVVQAMEHPVNESGLMLPGRRDVFVTGPPGKPNPDMSGFILPDYHQQSVIMASIEFPATFDVITAPSFGDEPAIRFDAPIGSDRVHVSFDINFLAQLIAISHQKWGKPTHFRGVTPRPG